MEMRKHERQRVPPRHVRKLVRKHRAAFALVPFRRLCRKHNDGREDSERYGYRDGFRDGERRQPLEAAGPGLVREKREQPRVIDLAGRPHEPLAKHPTNHQTREKSHRREQVSDGRDKRPREAVLARRGQSTGGETRRGGVHPLGICRPILRPAKNAWISQRLLSQVGLRVGEAGDDVLSVRIRRHPRWARQNHRKAGYGPAEDRHGKRRDEHPFPNQEFQRRVFGSNEGQATEHRQRQGARGRLCQVRSQFRENPAAHHLRSFARAILRANSSSSFRSSTSASTMPTSSSSTEPPQKRSTIEWTARAATLARGNRAR